MSSYPVIPRPQEGEYAPYTIAYISLVPDAVSIPDLLAASLTEVQRRFGALTDEVTATPHAAGEWTIKDILVHITDTERVFSYRTLRLARGDSGTELPGFDQAAYAIAARANERPLAAILADYAAVRAASISLIHSLDPATWENRGIVSKNPTTVRAGIYIIAGHERHHLNSIRENYGV